MRLAKWYAMVCSILLALLVFWQGGAVARHKSRPALCRHSELARTVGHSLALSQAGIRPDSIRCCIPKLVKKSKPVLITVTNTGMGGGPYLEFLLFEDGQAILDSDQSATGLLTWQLSEREMNEFKALIERLGQVKQSDLRNNIFCVTDLGSSAYSFRKADGTMAAISVEGSIGDSFWLMNSEEQATFSSVPESVLDIYYQTHAMPETAEPWFPEELVLTISPLAANDKTDLPDKTSVWKPSAETASKVLEKRTIQSNEIGAAEFLALCKLKGRILRAVIGTENYALELASGVSPAR